MLNEAVVEELVKKLNQELNVPFITEAQEERVIRWLVGLVAPKVPVWVLAFMSSVATGTTVEELKEHEDVIVAEVNKLVDVPWTPENIEAALIRPIVHAILEYALVGNKMPGV